MKMFRGVQLGKSEAIMYAVHLRVLVWFISLVWLGVPGAVWDSYAWFSGFILASCVLGLITGTGWHIIRRRRIKERKVIRARNAEMKQLRDEMDALTDTGDSFSSMGLYAEAAETFLAAKNKSKDFRKRIEEWEAADKEELDKELGEDKKTK